MCHRRLTCLTILINLALSAWAQQEYKLTPEDLAKHEKTLAANPEDQGLRGRLLGYYYKRTDEESLRAKFHLIEWLIANHPDSPLLYGETASLVSADFKPPLDSELPVMVAAWRKQLDKHPDDVKVLENVVRGLYQADYNLPVECLKHLRQIEPTNPRWAVILASTYVGAITSPDLSPRALGDLDKSKDVAVIGLVGQGIFAVARQAKVPQLAQFAESLLKRAQELDPLNPRWTPAGSENPGLLAERDMWAFGAVPAMPVPEGAVRVPAATQASKLLHSEPPQCIPGPQAICPKTKTTTKLSALIGKDGHVKSLYAATGDMTTIPAAMDAARMWTYKPTIVNGAPVEVMTDINLVYTPPKPEAANPAGPKPLPSNAMPAFTPPTPLTKVEPDYSPEAHAAKLTTSVKVSLIVDEKGMPKDVKVYKSAGMGLDEKAVEAVKKWTFRPGMRDGKPVAVPAVVDVYFKSN